MAEIQNNLIEKHGKSQRLPNIIIFLFINLSPLGYLKSFSASSIIPSIRNDSLY